MAGEQKTNTEDYADLDVLLDNPEGQPTESNPPEPDEQPTSEGNPDENGGAGPAAAGSQETPTEQGDEPSQTNEGPQGDEAPKNIEVSIEEMEAILGRNEEEAAKKLEALFGAAAPKQEQPPVQQPAPQQPAPQAHQAPQVPDLGKIELPSEYEEFEPVAKAVQDYVGNAVLVAYQSILGALPQYLVPVVAPMIDKGFSWGFAQQDFLSKNPELSDSPKGFELAVYEALQENPDYEDPSEIFSKAKDKLGTALAVRKKVAAMKAKKVDARGSRKSFSAQGTPSAQSRPAAPNASAQVDPQVEAFKEVIEANKENL